MWKLDWSGRQAPRKWHGTEMERIVSRFTVHAAHRAPPPAHHGGIEKSGRIGFRFCGSEQRWNATEGRGWETHSTQHPRRGYTGMRGLGYANNEKGKSGIIQSIRSVKQTQYTSMHRQTQHTDIQRETHTRGQTSHTPLERQCTHIRISTQASTTNRIEQRTPAEMCMHKMG